MITIEILLSYSLVLIAVAGGSFSLGYTIGRLSGKRK